MGRSLVQRSFTVSPCFTRTRRMDCGTRPPWTLRSKVSSAARAESEKPRSRIAVMARTHSVPQTARKSPLLACGERVRVRGSPKNRRLSVPAQPRTFLTAWTGNIPDTFSVLFSPAFPRRGAGGVARGEADRGSSRGGLRLGDAVENPAVVVGRRHGRGAADGRPHQAADVVREAAHGIPRRLR